MNRKIYTKTKSKVSRLLIVLSLILCGTITAEAQDIILTFANAEITNDGTDDYYEADIQISSTTDFYVGSGQLYVEYNPAAFGTFISSSGAIEYSQPVGSILGHTWPGFPFPTPAYKDFIQNDNNSSRVSLSFQQNIAAVGLETAPEIQITSTAKTLFHIKIKFIDSNEDPNICFYSDGVFQDQFITACGGTSTADCTSSPGTQLFNDTYDCSGAVIVATAPIITLLGDNPQVIELGAGYTEFGATTNDGSAVIIDASNFVDAVGIYNITYDATNAGIAAMQVIRTVNVVDTTAPIITLLGANPQVIELGDGYTELGATTNDGSTVIIDASAFLDAVGTYSVTYDATDSEGNDAVQVIRTVNVVDTTAPIITLLGDNPQVIELGDGYTELGATTNDGSAVIIDASAFLDAVGTYSIIYDASDSEGNDAVQVIRTVNVVDTTAPIITLLGDNPQVIELGDGYTELGATTNDGSAVVIDASAFVDAIGTYSIIYDASDSEGNDAVQVIRTVNVVDTTAPIITLNGPNPQTIELGDGYTELGATTNDGSAVVIDASAFVDAVGTYSVTYDAVDSEGNSAAQVIRTVNVVDTTAPIITLLGDNPQIIELGDGYTELGATTNDGSAVVIDASAFLDAVGSYSVTYDAVDSEGNSAAQVIRTVNVVDTTAPIITLNGPNPQTIELGDGYTELGATTNDGSAVVIDASAFVDAIGTYSIIYDASDSEGNDAVQVIRTVNVVDTTAPIITLNGPNPQTIELGDGYTELGATTNDGSAVVIDASAFVDAVGTYSVTYDAVDSEGNSAAQVIRTVNVVDTTAPIITLLGDNPQIIELGDGYTELGATTNDGSAVVIDASAFLDAVGSYSVTYDAVDSEGNSAAQVIRTVNVVDTTAPIITLNGPNPQTIELGDGYTELGATTNDGSAVVIDTSEFVDAIGTYSITYDAMDSEGNSAAQVIRTVNVVDTTAPIITLLGANPQVIHLGDGYTELGATTNDGSAVVIDASAFLDAVGSYSVTYDAVDSEGNAAAQVIRTVNVVDTTAPIITLLGANPQVIQLGDGYTELGATTNDGSAVVIDASAFLDAVGSYSVTYDAVDSEGNAAAQVIRTVNVVDTTAPIITLLGASPQVIQLGDGYTELGATTNDGSAVVIDASDFVDAVGTYSITYDAVDSEGNSAAQVIRTVNVVDTIAPIITLLGDNPQIIELGDGYTELGATTNDGSAVVIDASDFVDAVGTYSITYDAVDSEGNSAAQVIRTVNVVDTTAPIITLIGNNPQIIQLGDGYTELGATTNDGSAVVIDASDFVDAVGTYSITYDAVDSEGNSAVQVIRTVNVVDTTAPIITLLGDNPQIIELGAGYTELGAATNDGSAVVIDASDFVDAVGTYSITYDAVDSEGNSAAQVIRTVNVVDTTAPIITLLGDNPQIIELGDGYTELGATTNDGSAVVIDASDFVDAVGTYSITYDAVDSEGNSAAQVIRTVNVVDTTAPIITLIGNNPQIIQLGDGYTELGATTNDGSAVVIDASDFVDAVGTYSITYDAVDSEGNSAAQVIRTVNVVDTTAPIITLLGDNPQIIELGAGYTELGATTNDGSAVVIDASDFVDAVGTYSITYDAVDSEGNSAAQVIRTVNVVDTTAPIITLIGNNPQIIELGAGYTELGATTNDGSAVVIDASDFVDAVGTYSITYDAVDSEGNSAAQVIRTVNVVDTTAPIITLIGNNPQIIQLGDGYTELGATTNDGSAVVIDPSDFVDAVGTYSITYDAVDSEGNSAVQVIRTVNVVDTTAPIITLLGDNPQIIELGDGYTELGATTNDGSAVVIDASAFVDAVGTYSVTYDAVDSEGNSAAQVIRTVNVVDTTAPIITLLGANPQVIQLGDGYTELGATTNDGSAVVIDASDFVDAVGTYSITYDAVDSEGNSAAQVIRTVNVVDTTAPIITLLGDNPQIIELGDGYTELGATTNDGSAVVIDASDFVDAVGTYSITYDAVDSEGNSAAQVIRTVNVVDTTAPIITLIGNNPQIIQLGDGYTELGATTNDGSAVVIDASDFVDAVGTYSITYDAVDSEGNSAAQVIRTVNVVDTTAPIITLLGDNPQIIELGDGYTELGATTNDGSAVVINASDFVDAVGTYSITYDAVDSEGNSAAQVIRTVNVVDTTAPIITLLGDNPQIIELGDGYTELGATTNDGSAVVIDASDFVNAVGTYSITYDAVDSEGNSAAQVIRTVNVVDTIAPIITLIGNNPQIIQLGDGYTELGATTNDGSAVVIDASDFVDAVGTYSITYDAVDSEGNSAVQVIRTVNVVDTTAPIITLLGDNPQIIELGDGYTELGATTNDGSAVVIDASYFVDAVGTYSITYDAVDSEGNSAAQVIRTVNVVDTTAPIITLLGDNPQIIELGDGYTELGATTNDGSAVVIDASDFVDAVGTYSITYDAVDSEGNSAAQVIRTVNVVDTTAPIITLLGDNPQIIELGDGYTELGATTNDGSAVVIDASDFVDAVGTYSITYDAVDSEGNSAAQVIRTVNVVDTTAPIITLLGDNPQIIELGDGYTELGATTNDGSAVVIDASDFLDAVGTYSVTYDAVDSEGNDAVQVIRTVNVVDTTAPIITLNGPNPQVIQLGDGYTELGATTNDGTAVVIDTSEFVDAIGTYSITYDAVDSEGNSAAQVIRTVNVVDTTAPIITLNGPNPQVIQLGDGYTELGATTNDGSAVVIDASAFLDAVGSYSVTYDAVDSEGNSAAQVIRTVNVVDTTAPIITLNGPNPQVIQLGDGYTELGATTNDGTAVVIDTSEFVDAIGTYSITYDAVDSEGNSAAQVIRTVNVVDTTAPIITLNGPNPQVIQLGDGYTELGATTNDGSAVVIDASAFLDAVGSYSVTYDAVDSEGNSAAQVIRTVNVVDTTAPIITLLGDNPQIIELGDGYTELGATTNDGSAVVIDASAFVDAVGTYSVTYDAVDIEGNAAAQVIRTVNVVDTTAPIITLLGDNPQVIELGDGYTELGATTNDGSAVMIDMSEFVDAVGMYNIYYNATDESGNAAEQVIRIVKVNDNTLSLVDVETSNIGLSPNPTTGLVHITGITSDYMIQVYDINGKLLLEKTSNMDNTLSIDNFSSGVYLIKLSNESGNAIKRLIKN